MAFGCLARYRYLCGMIRVGLDAKRIVRNGTGMGSYGRTLACDLARQDDLQLTLYAPDAGRSELRMQVPNSNWYYQSWLMGKKGVAR